MSDVGLPRTNTMSALRPAIMRPRSRSRNVSAVCIVAPVRTSIGESPAVQKFEFAVKAGAVSDASSGACVSPREGGFSVHAGDESLRPSTRRWHRGRLRRRSVRLKCCLIRLDRKSRTRGSASNASRGPGTSPSATTSVAITKTFCARMRAASRESALPLRQICTKPSMPLNSAMSTSPMVST